MEAIKNPSIEFYFFQSKTATSFDYGEISKFFDAVSGFFNGDLRGESDAVDDLMDAKDTIYKLALSKKNPAINCFYATTGNYDEPARIEKLKATFATQLEDTNIFDSDRIKVAFVGARELQQWYRAATTSFEAEIEFPRNVVMPSNSHVVEAYIGYITAENLLQLYTSRDANGDVIGINRSVFVDNIRDYDPTSKINAAIKKSVVEDGGGDFVFRNNGITVVAKSVDRTGDKFQIEEFQIVNGCQTSNIIYDLIYGDSTIELDDGTEKSLDDKAKTTLGSSIQVPFRLIEASDDDFVASIIVGTNSQNSVRYEQFWALRPFMKNLEEYCGALQNDEALYLERRENQYRGQSIEQRARIIQPAALMKAVAAGILFQPHRAARDYRGILAEYNDAIFLDSHDVRIYHAIGYLQYRLENLWRNKKIGTVSKTLRYYIIAGIGLVLTKGADIFKMKANKIAKVASNIVDLSGNEDDLLYLVNKIVDVITAQLVELNVTVQERVRDTIRLETFEHKFREKVLAGKYPQATKYIVTDK